MGEGQGPESCHSKLANYFFFPLERHGNRFGTSYSFVLEILLYKYTAKTVYTINNKRVCLIIYMIVYLVDRSSIP